MAQVFGEPSRNAAEESFKQTKKLVASALVGIGALAFIGGYAFGAALPIRDFSLVWALVIAALMSALMWLIGKWGTDRIDDIDRKRMAWRKGAVGEAVVAGLLEALPNDFIVINDVSKRLGNLDHVVIGPTGIYVIDTKQWKGTIKADGAGELVLNNKRLKKPPIKGMLSNVMDFQNKLRALTGLDRFVRGLMVFPIAYVETSFGSTGHIHCLRDERLVDYIQDKAFGNRLTVQDIDKIKQATLQLAGMDKRFAV